MAVGGQKEDNRIWKTMSSIQRQQSEAIGQCQILKIDSRLQSLRGEYLSSVDTSRTSKHYRAGFLLTPFSG